MRVRIDVRVVNGFPVDPGDPGDPAFRVFHPPIYYYYNVIIKLHTPLTAYPNTHVITYNSQLISVGHHD